MNKELVKLLDSSKFNPALTFSDENIKSVSEDQKTVVYRLMDVNGCDFGKVTVIFPSSGRSRTRYMTFLMDNKVPERKWGNSNKKLLRVVYIVRVIEYEDLYSVDESGRITNHTTEKRMVHYQYNHDVSKQVITIGIFREYDFGNYMIRYRIPENLMDDYKTKIEKQREEFQNEVAIINGVEDDNIVLVARKERMHRNKDTKADKFIEEVRESIVYPDYDYIIGDKFAFLSRYDTVCRKALKGYLNAIEKVNLRYSLDDKNYYKLSFSHKDFSFIYNADKFSFYADILVESMRLNKDFINLGRGSNTLNVVFKIYDGYSWDTDFRNNYLIKNMFVKYFKEEKNRLSLIGFIKNNDEELLIQIPLKKRLHTPSNVRMLKIVRTIY